MARTKKDVVQEAKDRFGVDLDPNNFTLAELEAALDALDPLKAAEDVLAAPPEDADQIGDLSPAADLEGLPANVIEGSEWSAVAVKARTQAGLEPPVSERREAYRALATAADHLANLLLGT